MIIAHGSQLSRNKSLVMHFGNPKHGYDFDGAELQMLPLGDFDDLGVVTLSVTISTLPFRKRPLFRILTIRASALRSPLAHIRLYEKHVLPIDLHAGPARNPS